MLLPGISKQTPYTKFYRPDIRLVQTTGHIRVYHADAFFPSAPMVKKRIRADVPLRLCERTPVYLRTKALPRRPNYASA
jgi:hypothetical protein